MDIQLIAVTPEKRHILMTLIVKVCGAEIVIKSAKVMDFQIVMICKQVAEPPAIPRSFGIVTTEAMLPTTLLSILDVNNYSSHLEKNKGSYPYEPLLYYHKLI